MTLRFHDRTSSRRRFTQYLAEREVRRSSKETDRKDPADQIRHGRGFRKLVWEFLKLLHGHRTIVLLILAMLTVGRFLSLAIPASTKFVIDYVLLGQPVPDRIRSILPISTDPRHLLIMLAVSVLGISTLSTFVHLWARWKATRLTQRVKVNVRRKLFQHAARLPLHKIHEIKSGGASSLLREDAGGVGDLVFNLLFNPWRAVVQLLGGLAVLLWVDYRLLAGCLLLLPIVYWNHQLWVRRIRPLYRDIKKQRQDIDAQTTEVFAGMRVVRAFGRQQREVSRFVGESHLMSRQEIHVWWSERIIEIIWDLIIPTASGALLLYGGWQVLDKKLSPGDLMMFLVYMTMLLEPIAILATSATAFQSNLAALDRVLDVLAEPRELPGPPSIKSASASLFDGPLQVEHVSFQYPGNSEQVLKDINLLIQPGETMALVGRSGSGKTTLCNLLARFYDPTRGRIMVGSTDLRDIHVETYRRFLGIVEQDVFLFDGTVADNIAYAARTAEISDIENAARVANAHEFISKLPSGYDTMIGERGVRLSGGQRQRIAIARAVLADPKLFILDEATSNLDSESEQLIQASLTELMKDRTSIVIAHRLSTVRDAHRIVVLDDGRIIEVGSHAVLMSQASRYRDMVERQQLDLVGSLE
ncbi:ABC transporter ATP-binding protein/permease [bacterium]|nr:ABC transporter ATP-binding protein/permease [bacterium]